MSGCIVWAMGGGGGATVSVVGEGATVSVVGEWRGGRGGGGGDCVDCVCSR